MIHGIGVDVVEVTRLDLALQRTPALAARLFTPAERTLPVASLAARFAAKEAVAKALGSGRGLRWQEIEVQREPSCSPRLVLSGTAARTAAQKGVRSWHLSLSHDGGIATAMVVAESG